MEPPNVAVAESSVDRLGVFATIDFAAGDTILLIDDSRVVDAAHPILPEEQRHCDYLAHGVTVLMRVPERYINHSCCPNTYVRTLGGVRHVLALRPIRVGEEITFDYCINSRGDTVWRCHCGTADCRQTIHSDFFHLPLEIQKKYLPLLDDWFRREWAAEVGEAERTPLESR